jgi:hypothetical protein
VLAVAVASVTARIGRSRLALDLVPFLSLLPLLLAERPIDGNNADEDEDEDSDTSPVPEDLEDRDTTPQPVGGAEDARIGRSRLALDLVPFLSLLPLLLAERPIDGNNATSDEDDDDEEGSSDEDEDEDSDTSPVPEDLEDRDLERNVADKEGGALRLRFLLFFVVVETVVLGATNEQ